MNTGRFPNASYKGFSNLVWMKDDLSQSWKKVLHEYPNRDRGYIENLGLGILQVSCTFRIYNPQDNDDIDEFERILKEGSKENETSAGILILPVIGSLEQMEVLSWNKSTSNSIFGYVEYTVQFAQTSKSQYPTSTETNAGFLDRLKDKLLGKNVTAFNKAFKSIKNKKQQLQKGLTKVRETGKQLNNLAKKVEGAGSLLSEFSNTLTAFTQDTARLLNSPNELAQNLKRSFDALEDSVQDVRLLFNIVSNYFGFSSGDDNAIGVGSIQSDIQANQNAINNNIRTNALAIAYAISPLIDYKTTQELDEFRKKLKDEYDALEEIIDEDILVDLEIIQINTNRILDRQVLTLATLTTVNVNSQPLSVYTYSLYGNLDRYDDLYNINNIKDARRIEGEITIISNV